MAGNVLREDKNPFIGEASASLSGLKHFFMKLTTGGKVAKVATGGDTPIGVLRFDDCDATGKVAVCDKNGQVRVKAGTSTGKPGDLLALSTSGKVVKHTQGTGTRVQIVGVALEDYATGDIFVAQIPAPFHRGEA